jgi:ATP-dependent Clp protease adaptor protein ClpS
MRRMFLKEQLVPEKSERLKRHPSQGRLVRVFIHNDRVTPMDFVVHVLITIFLVPSPNAEHIMYTAHLTGCAYVQTLPSVEAQLRINKARFAAGLRGLPLQFSMEPE